MTKQKIHRVIMNIRDMGNYNYGSVIAGKAGRIFELPHDYYKIGLITPPISRERSEELVLDEILEASSECYTPALIRKINNRIFETGDYDNQLPRMPNSYSEICIYCHKHYFGRKFQALQNKLNGMPRNRWLFTFDAPVPEDYSLAEMVAEEFEKTLMQSSSFRNMVKRWNKV